jgi:hypothetical protein
MNHLKHDALLDDLLGGEPTAALRTASLDQILALARRRRRRRQAGRAIGLLALPVLLTASLAALQLRRSVPGKPQLSAAPPTPGQAAVRASGLADEVRPSVRFLTDNELLDLFPGRPVALIGPPGQQTLVFLDQLSAGPGG